jgi:hypothetical protein
MPQVQVGNMMMRDGTISWVLTRDGAPVFIKAHEFDVSSDRLRLDSTFLLEPLSVLTKNKHSLSAQYVEMHRPTHDQFLSLNRIQLSTAPANLEADGLYFIQHHSDSTSPTKASLDKLSVQQADMLLLMEKGKLKARQVALSGGHVQLALHEPDTGRVRQRGYIAEKLPLGPVEIAQFSLSNTDFDATISHGRHQSHLHVPSVSASASGLHFDPAQDETSILKSQAFTIDLGNLKYNIPHHKKTLTAEGLAIDVAAETIVASNIALTPHIGKYEYAPFIGEQADWIRMSSAGVIMSGVDFDALLKRRAIDIESILFEAPDLLVFRDKRQPLQPKQKEMPMDALQDLAIPVHINSIKVNDGSVVYQEHAEEAIHPGEVFFTHLNVEINDVSNTSERQATDTLVRIQASAQFMDTARIDFRVIFHANEDRHWHQMTVELSPFDLTELNRILAPNAFVLIKSGTNERLRLTAQLNPEYSEGEMLFHYDNLHIALLNKNTEAPRGLGKALATFIANTFVINTNNPHFLVARTGDVYYHRDSTKSIFNFWVKSFLSGAVSSVGIKKGLSGKE